MPLIPNMAVFRRKLAGFPIATYQAGETVLTTASTTGRLLILRKGAVAVLREGIEIATVTEPGAVFGELSVLLDQPHTADVRALEASQFYVADAATLLRVDPIALLYVATVLARRLDDANQALIELRRQVQAGRPRNVIEKTAEKMERLLGASGVVPKCLASTCRDARASRRVIEQATDFAAPRSVAIGTKRTYRQVCYLTAFGGKADISEALDGDQLIQPVDPEASLRLLLTSFGAGDPHFVRVTVSLMI
jgi:CRP-like cAMP-binding protein